MVEAFPPVELPPRWGPRGPDAPADVAAVVAAARRLLAGQPADAGFALQPVAKKVGNHKLYRLVRGGEVYALKAFRPDRRPRVRREWGALRLFAERGLAAPAPVALVDEPGAPHGDSAPAAPPAFVLMTWLPGQPLGEAALTRPQLRAIADVCRQLYAITPDSSADALWDAFWHPALRLPQQRAELAKIQALPAPATRELGHYLQTWLAGPDPDLLLAPSPLAFSRGDPNIDNCLWTGTGINIVDFEGCGWRPRAGDLATITDHIQSRRTAHEDWDYFVDLFDLDAAEGRLLRAGQRQLALRWAARECLEPGSLTSLPDAERMDILLDRVRYVCRP